MNTASSTAPFSTPAPVLTADSNPKFQFYFGLYQLLAQKRSFNWALAERVANLHQAHSQDINFAGEITPDLLNSWQQELHHPSADEGEVFQKLTVRAAKALFQDLAPQMRSLPIRQLHLSFKSLAGLDGDLFIHIRRVKLFDASTASFTAVTDDQARLQKFLDHPKGAVWPADLVVHLTESVDEEDEAEQGIE